MTISVGLIVGLIIVAGITSYLLKKLTLSAAIVGVGMALVIYLGAGWIALVILAVFFILGTVATSHKKDLKVRTRLMETTGGKRKASQVLANGGVAAILSLMFFLMKEHHTVLLVMIAGSFSSATADTLSSELGNVYGRNFYNILTFRKDQRGLDGVISLEGTLFGILGSLIIASVYAIAFGWNFAFGAILIAGTAGNLFDSYLGATLERKGLIGNDFVNFLNTFFAALIALFCMIG